MRKIIVFEERLEPIEISEIPSTAIRTLTSINEARMYYNECNCHTYYDVLLSKETNKFKNNFINYTKSRFGDKKFILSEILKLYKDNVFFVKDKKIYLYSDISSKRYLDVIKKARNLFYEVLKKVLVIYLEGIIDNKYKSFSGTKLLNYIIASKVLGNVSVSVFRDMNLDKKTVDKIYSDKLISYDLSEMLFSSSRGDAVRSSFLYDDCVLFDGDAKDYFKVLYKNYLNVGLKINSITKNRNNYTIEFVEIRTKKSVVISESIDLYNESISKFVDVIVDKINSDIIDDAMFTFFFTSVDMTSPIFFDLTTKINLVKYLIDLYCLISNDVDFSKIIYTNNKQVSLSTVEEFISYIKKKLDLLLKNEKSSEIENFINKIANKCCNILVDPSSVMTNNINYCDLQFLFNRYIRENRLNYLGGDADSMLDKAFNGVDIFEGYPIGCNLLSIGSLSTSLNVVSNPSFYTSLSEELISYFKSFMSMYIIFNNRLYFGNKLIAELNFNKDGLVDSCKKNYVIVLCSVILDMAKKIINYGREIIMFSNAVSLISPNILVCEVFSKYSMEEVYTTFAGLNNLLIDSSSFISGYRINAIYDAINDKIYFLKNKKIYPRSLYYEIEVSNIRKKLGIKSDPYILNRAFIDQVVVYDKYNKTELGLCSHMDEFMSYAPFTFASLMTNPFDYESYGIDDENNMLGKLSKFENLILCGSKKLIDISNKLYISYDSDKIYRNWSITTKIPLISESIILFFNNGKFADLSYMHLASDTDIVERKNYGINYIPIDINDEFLIIDIDNNDICKTELECNLQSGNVAVCRGNSLYSLKNTYKLMNSNFSLDNLSNGDISTLLFSDTNEVTAIDFVNINVNSKQIGKFLGMKLINGINKRLRFDRLLNFIQPAIQRFRLNQFKIYANYLHSKIKNVVNIDIDSIDCFISGNNLFAIDKIDKLPLYRLNGLPNMKELYKYTIIISTSESIINKNDSNKLYPIFQMSIDINKVANANISYVIYSGKKLNIDEINEMIEKVHDSIQYQITNDDII